MVQRFPLTTANKPGMTGFTRADGDCADTLEAIEAAIAAGAGTVETPVINYEQILFGPVSIPLKDCAERCRAARQCIGLSFRFKDNMCVLRSKACDRIVPSLEANFYLKGLIISCFFFESPFQQFSLN